MKTLVVIVAFVHCVRASPLFTEEDEYVFKTWMSEHNKQYDLDEYYQRLQIFTQNKKMIDTHNAGNHKFTRDWNLYRFDHGQSSFTSFRVIGEEGQEMGVGLNQFSDMTFAEFKKFYLLKEPQECNATKGNHVRGGGLYPDSIDWRKKGHYVSDVKNQGACGSCWTFSTTGCLESVTAIATGKLPLLSEQQLVDCAGAFNNHGCNGGLPSQAFEYIMYNKGLMTEDDYPYVGRDGPCKFDPKLASAFVKDVVNITKYDEMGIVDAVARLNPVSIAFEVLPEFMSYRDGVYTSTKCHNSTETVNHAVLAVGYAEENGTPYWIVKNSWGPQWGIDGYFYIERGKNMCGLAACASYPVV